MRELLLSKPCGLGLCLLAAVSLHAAPGLAADFVCGPRPDVTPPPPEVTTTKRLDPPRAPCPPGQVPVPVEKYGAKVMLPRSGAGQAHWVWPGSNIHAATAAAPNYFFAGVEQEVSTVVMRADVTEEAPWLDLDDSLTLAEIGIESSDQNDAVMAGWLVDYDVNEDFDPHLFVYHWVDGNGTCFNACGWVQVSETYYPGMALLPGTDPLRYAVRHDVSSSGQGNWWVWYDSEWIGYFPDTIWSGGFTRGEVLQWLGVVSAASETNPASEMGNGTFGHSTGSAEMSGLGYDDSSGTAVAANVSPTTTTLPAAYDMALVSANRFRYGGPGLVPCEPRCTGLECGDDGCGGSCGTCGSGLSCSSGVCVGGPGTTCDNPIALTPSGTQHVMGNTNHAGENYTGTCGGLSRDRVYSFTLSTAMVLDAQVSGFDTVMYLRSQCAESASELVCNNDDVSSEGSRINASLGAGTYYLFVDGYAAAQGDYDLTATFSTGCVAETCSSVANRCGTLSNGCGGTLTCPGCASPLTCGGAGVPNVCGMAPDAGMPDAGPRDAGPADAGPRDAGPVDAGLPDAGPSDAGPPDGGPMAPDAGQPGEPDAGPVTTDAGNPTATDAGSTSSGDGGSFSLPPKKDQVAAKKGCGCTALDGSASLVQAALLVLVGLRTRRRRPV